MYWPPSDLNLFCNHFTGWEDEPMHCLPHLTRIQCQLLTLYVHSLNIPEECVLPMNHIFISEFEESFYDTAPSSVQSLPIFWPWQVQSTTTTAPTILTL